MKIVVDARVLGENPSGIGIYLYDFIRMLSENKKYELILLTDVKKSEHLYFFRKKWSLSS